MKLMEVYKSVIKEQRDNTTSYPIADFYKWWKQMMPLFGQVDISMPKFVPSNSSSIVTPQAARDLIIKFLKSDKSIKGYIWAIFWKDSDINYLADRELKPAHVAAQMFNLEKLYEIFKKDPKLLRHVSQINLGFSSSSDNAHFQDMQKFTKD